MGPIADPAPGPLDPHLAMDGSFISTSLDSCGPHGCGFGSTGRRHDRKPAAEEQAARPGATVSEIAGKLFLSEGTVRNYLSAAIAKTGTRNRAEAVQRAEEHGWL